MVRVGGGAEGTEEGMGVGPGRAGCAAAAAAGNAGGGPPAAMAGVMVALLGLVVLVGGSWFLLGVIGSSMWTGMGGIARFFSRWSCWFCLLMLM